MSVQCQKYQYSVRNVSTVSEMSVQCKKCQYIVRNVSTVSEISVLCQKCQYSVRNVSTVSEMSVQCTAQSVGREPGVSEWCLDVNSRQTVWKCLQILHSVWNV